MSDDMAIQADLLSAVRGGAHNVVTRDNKGVCGRMKPSSVFPSQNKVNSRKSISYRKCNLC